MLKKILFLLPFLVLLLVIFTLFTFNNSFESIEVHFCPEDCENTFINFLNNSDELLCALFDLDYKPAIKILKEKNATVYIDYRNNENFTLIKRKALMHNKICVNDDTVFTGSMNPTDRGINYNNNNLVLIKSKDIANLYENYINMVLLKDEYFKHDNNFLNDKIQIYFCPQDYCSDTLSNLLLSSKESIYFMTFSFTDKRLANDLIIKYYENVDISGVFERNQASKYSVYEYLKYHNISVYLDKSKYNLHHKVFIIDKKIVVTGSYNPSLNGDKRNDENMLVINDKDIVSLYLSEYEKLIKEH